MWFDAADPSSFTPAYPTSGSGITAWRDKSSNANNLVKASTDSPLYQSSGFNSRPSVYFNLSGVGTYGTQSTQWMQASNATNFSNFYPQGGVNTMFMVFSQTGGVCGGMWLQWTGNASGYSSGVQAFGGNNLCMSVYGTNNVISNALSNNLIVTYVTRAGTYYTTPDSYDQYCYNSNMTSNPYIYLNVAPSATESWNFSEKFVIGAKDSNGNYYAQGYHAEYIMYNQTLTTTQLNTVWGYLGTKWGLQTSLTVTSPFYSTPLQGRRFSPIDIAGCQLWLDATDSSSITLTGSNMTQWNDKSGYSNTMTPHSTYSNATISSAYQNGLNVLNFSGSGVYKAASNSACYPIDLYIVVALKCLYCS